MSGYNYTTINHLYNLYFYNNEYKYKVYNNSTYESLFEYYQLFISFQSDSLYIKDKSFTHELSSHCNL